MDPDIRRKIETLLDQHRIMTIATLRADGWPQATTVGYVSEGLTLYFLCGLDSQKAANLARDDRAEAEKVLRLLPLTYPEQTTLPVPMPKPGDVRIFRLTPTVISVLDYTKGFGHTDLVAC